MADMGRRKPSADEPLHTLPLDASGDMANDGRNSYWYDAEGRVCAVHSSVTGTNVQYVYGPSGERVAQGTPGSLPSGTTALCSAPSASGSAFSNISVNKRYLVDQGGQQVTELNGSGAWTHSNLFSGGKLTVSYDAKGIHYDPPTRRPANPPTAPPAAARAAQYTPRATGPLRASARGPQSASRSSSAPPAPVPPGPPQSPATGRGSAAGWW